MLWCPSLDHALHQACELQCSLMHRCSSEQLPVVPALISVWCSSTGDTGSLETHIRQLDKALNTSCFHLQQTENIIRSRTPTGPELDATYMGYVSENRNCHCSKNVLAFAKLIKWLVCYILFSQMRLLEECRGSIDAVKRVGFELKDEEDKTSGFVNPNSSESQTSGTKTISYTVPCT